MKVKKQNGITLVALIITIVIMLILVGVVMYFGEDAIDTAKLEDIKANMFSIKTRAKIVADKYNFKDIENLVGTKYTEDTIHDKQKLESVFSTFTDEQKSYLYIWTQEDLNNNGLNSIKVDTQSFYVVYYNLGETNSCQIYYSNGYQEKYSLTDLQDM